MRSTRVCLLGASLVLAAAFFAACAAPAAVATPPATAVPGSTTAATTASAATTGPVSTKPAAKVPSVDLTFSGTVAFVAKGSKGTCQIGKRSDGTFDFGFFMTEADYPGLGASFQLNEDLVSHKFDVKWITPGGNVPFFGIMAGGVTVSGDHHAIQLDADLPPSDDKTEHVKGSITCP